MGINNIEFRFSQFSFLQYYGRVFLVLRTTSDVGRGAVA